MSSEQRIRSLSACETADLVAAGEISAVEAVEAHVAALERAAPLGLAITICADRALERARAGVSGPLAGVPLLVKDLFDLEGVRTTYGSAIYRDHVPARTAEAVRRLEAAGAIAIGKANLDEFAWGTTSQNPHYGTVRNPVRPGKVAGGSSGGNAAALAAHVGALGLGTDTGGSVRIPAACCGVVGFKTPAGAVPDEGCLPLAPTMDTVGPLARTVADCARAYAVLAGRAVPSPRLAGLRIGLLERAPKASPLEPAGSDAGYAAATIAQRAAALESLGATVLPVELPEPEADVIPVFLDEVVASHRATWPSRRDDYGPVCRAKWDVAARVPAADVLAARAALPAWRARAAREPDVDLLVCPTISIEPPDDTVHEPDVRVQMVAFTRVVNLLGWPSLAIADFQLFGRDDMTVLAAGLAWEEAYGPPPLPAPGSGDCW